MRTREPGTGQNGAALGLLLITPGMLIGMAMTGLSPVLPAIEHAFADAAGIGFLGKLVISAVGLGVMMGATLVTFLLSRFGLHRLLGSALACYGLATVASAAAPTISLLIAARLILGISAAIVATIAVALIGVTGAPEKRAGRIGYHMAFSALAMFVLLPAAGLLGNMDWRLAPLLGLIAFAYLPLLAHLRPLLEDIALDSKVDSNPGRDTPTMLSGRTIMMCLLALAIGIAAYSGPAFLAFKASAIGIVDAWHISLLATASMVGALSAFFYGALTSRFSGSMTTVIAFGTAAAGTALVASASDATMLTAANALAGIGGGLVIAHLYALAAMLYPPQHKVMMIGLVKAASFFGLFCGPLALQLVMVSASVEAVFATMGMVFACAGLLALLVKSSPTIADAI